MEPIYTVGGNISWYSHYADGLNTSPDIYYGQTKVFNWLEKISYIHKNRKEETGIHTNLTKKYYLVQYESRAKMVQIKDNLILLRPNCQYTFTPALSQNRFNAAYKNIWDKWREHKRCENKRKNNGKDTEWIIAKKNTLIKMDIRSVYQLPKIFWGQTTILWTKNKQTFLPRGPINKQCI